jgi:hypothetical protein
VCLILELLPMSLQQLLYNTPLSTQHHTSANDAGMQTAMVQLKTDYATALSNSRTSSARIPATIMPGLFDQQIVASPSDTHRSAQMGSVSGGVGDGGANSGGYDAAVILGLKGAEVGPHSQTSSAIAATSFAEMDASGSVRTCARNNLSMLRVLQICTDMAQGLAFLHATPLVPPSNLSELQDASVQISVHDPAGGTSGSHSDAASVPMAAKSDQGVASMKMSRVVHRGGFQTVQCVRGLGGRGKGTQTTMIPIKTCYVLLSAAVALYISWLTSH